MDVFPNSPKSHQYLGRFCNQNSAKDQLKIAQSDRTEFTLAIDIVLVCSEYNLDVIIFSNLINEKVIIHHRSPSRYIPMLSS